MSDLIGTISRHYFSCLGEPERSRDVSLDPRHNLGFQVNEYHDVPSVGAVTLLTLGLSTSRSHTFGEELVVSCYLQYLDDALVNLIGAVAREIAMSSHPLYKGEVLSLADRISGTEMVALYIYPPVYLPDKFEPITTHDGSVVHVAWLIPIYEREADWIKVHDSQAFESLLETQDPDLMDLVRPSVI